MLQANKEIKMLEVLYDTATKEVRAWNADMKVKGNLKPKEGQKVVILPIDPPIESGWYKVDLVNKQIVGNPDYVPIAPRDLLAEIDELKARLDKITKVKE